MQMHPSKFSVRLHRGDGNWIYRKKVKSVLLVLQAFLAAAPGNAHPVLFAAQWDQYASSTPVKLDFGAPEDVLLPPVLPRADWRSSNSPCWYI